MAFPLRAVAAGYCEEGSAGAAGAMKHTAVLAGMRPPPTRGRPLSPVQEHVLGAAGDAEPTGLRSEASGDRADSEYVPGDLEPDVITRITQQVLTALVQSSIQELRRDVALLKHQHGALVVNVREHRTSLAQQRVAIDELSQRTARESADVTAAGPAAAAGDGVGRSADTGGSAGDPGLCPPTAADEAGATSPFRTRVEVVEELREEFRALARSHTQAAFEEFDRQCMDELKTVVRDSCAGFQHEMQASHNALVRLVEQATDATQIKSLAEDMARLASSGEQRYLELARAMEAERTARDEEAAEVRAALFRLEQDLKERPALQHKTQEVCESGGVGAGRRPAAAPSHSVEWAPEGATAVCAAACEEASKSDAGIGAVVALAPTLQAPAAKQRAPAPGSPRQQDLGSIAARLAYARRAATSGRGSRPVLGGLCALRQPPPAPPTADAKGGGVHSVPFALRGVAGSGRLAGPAIARRRALVITCSYLLSRRPLLGALNDAWNVLSLLRHTLHYREDQVRFVADGSAHIRASSHAPTREGILQGLRFLTEGAQPGDDVLLYFSGYCTHRPSASAPGLHEACLVPSDFVEDVDGAVREQLLAAPAATAGKVGGVATPASPAAAPPAAAGSSDYRLVPLHEIAVALAALPASCRATVVLDAGHAVVPGLGVAGEVAPVDFQARAAPHSAWAPDPSWPAAVARFWELPRLPCHGAGCRGVGGPAAAGGVAVARRQPPQVSCVAACFSPCQPEQMCWELPIEGVPQGALTWAWVKSAAEAYEDLAGSQMRAALAASVAELGRAFPGLDQRPYVQVSSAARSAEGGDTAAAARSRPRPVSRPLAPKPRRRKALVVGINYVGCHAQLKGGTNDAWNLHCMLRHTLQFGKDEVRILVDEESANHTFNSQSEAAARPTRANILAGVEWLLEGAHTGDCLVFAYCGFGAQHPQGPGSELQESYLVPCDFAADLPKAFQVSLQDTMQSPAIPESLSKGYRLVPLLELSNLIAWLPKGVALTMVLDCAYPVVPGIGPEATSPATFPKVKRGRVDYAKLHDFVSRPRFLELPALPISHSFGKTSQGPAGLPQCIVRCFSACRLPEWNAELPLEGTVQGSFTWAFIKALAAGNFESSVGQFQRQLVVAMEDLRRDFSGVEQSPVVHLSRTASLDDLVFGVAGASPAQP